MHLTDTFIQIDFKTYCTTLSILHSLGSECMLYCLSYSNAILKACVCRWRRLWSCTSSCGSGWVGGGGRAQRGGKVHSVEDAAGGAGQDGRVVKQYTMNPKAMPRQQLLGHIDMDARVVRRGADVLRTTGGARATGWGGQIHILTRSMNVKYTC